MNMVIQSKYKIYIYRIANLKSIFGFISSFTFAALLLACATPKTYYSFADWDASKDLRLDRREFVDAYIDQKYFDAWSPNGMSLSQQTFFDAVFNSLDSDRGGSLSIAEFNTHIKSFYFGLFHDTFGKWDENNNANISRQEFKTRVSSSNLAGIWDTNSDMNISERELAGGMFYICDIDGDGYINEIELETWKRNQAV
jgi:Ca2+-binding EF-hand superfamily protein